MNGFYNRLACKITIANPGGPVKRKINEEKENVLSYNNSYSMIIVINENVKRIYEEFERI